MEPCDDVLYPNESFAVPGIYRVDKLDLSTDRVYNSVLDAWGPLTTLLEYGANVDDVLYVGECFTFYSLKTGINESYKVTGNSGITRIQTIMKNKWRSWKYVWLNDGSLIEVGCY